MKWNTSPIDGITVELRRTSDYSIIATTKADVNGVFRFANVPADTYTTSLVIPSGSQFQGWITPGYKTVAAGAEIDLGTTQVMKILTGLSPNGATVTLPQTLYWSPVPEASYYYIEIYEGPTITGQAFLTATVNIAQYTLSSVRADKRYAWAVYAIAQPSVYLARGTATFQIP